MPLKLYLKTIGRALVAGTIGGLLVFVLLFAMSSCAEANDIVWKKTSVDAISSHCAKNFNRNAENKGFKIMGCQYLEQTSFMHWSCIIEVPDTYNETVLRNTLRHEIKHCVKGNFHYNIPHYNDSQDTDLDDYNQQYDELIQTGKSTY